MRDMPAPIPERPGAVAGLVLAAGAGRRFGMPKALASTPDDRAWLAIAAERLRSAGCDPVIVVLGADADRAEDAVPGWARMIVADDWAAGQSASLRAGLEAVALTDAAAVLITLVDLPDASVEAERRVLGAFDGTASLARAVDDGRPAHPVLIGRDHWGPLADSLRGDRGARDYLRTTGARPIDVTGLGGADDVDLAAD